MLDLPFDIWNTVSKFLPRVELFNLAVVNRGFLQVFRKQAFSEVTLSSYRQTHKLAKALQYQPQLAELVDCVRVRPWYVAPRVKKSSRAVRMRARVKRLLDSTYELRQGEKQARKRMLKHVRATSNLVSRFRNATQLRIEWHDAEPRHHPEFFRELLDPVLSKIRSNLVSLYIKVPVNFLELLPIVGRMPKLDDLSVFFVTGENALKDVQTWLDGFMVFIHNHMDIVSSLSIFSTSASQYLDLGRLFRDSKFNNLHKFLLSIPSDGIHLEDPLQLQSFLYRHRGTIRELRLRAGSCSASSHSGVRHHGWIKDGLADVQNGNPYAFGQLHTVEVALRPLKADLTPFENWLRAHVDSLESVNLTDRALDFDEAKRVIKVLASYPGLAQLSMRLSSLSPELFDLFTSHLPHLLKLSLRFVGISYGEYSEDLALRSQNLVNELFHERMIMRGTRKDYVDWDLQSLSLKWIGKRDRDYVDSMESTFTKIIPSLDVVRELVKE